MQLACEIKWQSNGPKFTSMLGPSKDQGGSQVQAHSATLVTAKSRPEPKLTQGQVDYQVNTLVQVNWLSNQNRLSSEHRLVSQPRLSS